MTTEIIYQFRVTWRRSDFSPKTGDRVKTFSSEGRALAFLAKLKGPGRAPLTVARLDRRRVGPWEPVPWAPR